LNFKMQLFLIKPDGEVHEVKGDKTFRELLDPAQCYVICDDEKKKIYLWKGASSSVRSKFIGASKSQDMRGQVGMHYVVVPIDEGEEPKELLDRIDEKPGKGVAKEIRETKELGFEVPGVAAGNAAVAAPKAPAQKANIGVGAPVTGGEGSKQVMGPVKNVNQQGSPMYTGNEPAVQNKSAAPAQQAAPQAHQPADEVSVDYKKVMQTLESLEIPLGYEREMVIIGNHAYSIIEKKVTFLGQTKIETAMEKISNLPEGVFFAAGYSPRVLCENQKVLAIEPNPVKN
jgi:hypothetical protein